MQPASVAIVGASPKASTGGRILASAIGSGFRGPIYPVNPNYTDVNGKQCFPSLSDLPDVPDCVVVALPVNHVLPIVEEAVRVGVPSGIVVAEGFADGDTEAGRARQQELRRIALDGGMAITGPCCMGLASLKYSFANSYFSIPSDGVPGGVSLISQSGGLTSAVTELGASRNVGFNYMISSGNEAVVEMADYIEYMADDPETKVIACIMEGPKDGPKLRRVLAATTRKKPVVVLKLGRTESGRRATVAHTGTLAGQHQAFVALFRETGVQLVDSIDQLVETAGVFLRSRMPAGKRVVFLTISGGATTLISDVNANVGLECQALTADTNEKLQEILEVDRPFGNPIDTVGMPRLQRGTNLTLVLEALLADSAIDVVGMALSMKRETGPGQQKLLDQVAACAKKAEKPIFVLSLASNSLTQDCRTFSETTAVPMLEDVEGGLRAVRKLVDYSEFLRKQNTRQGTVSRIETVKLDVPDNVSTLTEYESKKILAEAGIAITREDLAGTSDAAVAAAETLGYPVVLKIQSPDVPHKSDAGGVYLGAKTQEEVRAGYHRIVKSVTTAHPEARIDGVLVQEMVSDGLEVIVGMVHDVQFGPLVMLGMGGIFVEVFKDAAFRLPPLVGDDVSEMLAELKGGALLEGLRGNQPYDVDALVECVVRFGDFVAQTAGQFSAVEMNPVMVRPCGRGIIVADALITGFGTRPSGLG